MEGEREGEGRGREGWKKEREKGEEGERVEEGRGREGWRERGRERMGRGSRRERMVGFRRQILTEDNHCLASH